MQLNEDSSEQSQYLSFLVSGAEYAIPILRAREILRYSGSTVVPMAPEAIRGLINLRGRAVPVVDLAVCFGLEETADSDRACVVIVDLESSDEDSVMGMLVEGVNEVISLGEDDIEDTPSFGTGIKAEYLTGMARAGERFIPILDVAYLLSSGAIGDSQEFAVRGLEARETSAEGVPAQSEEEAPAELRNPDNV